VPQAIPLVAAIGASVLLPGSGLYVLQAGTLGNILISGAVAYGTTRLLGLDEPPKIAAPGIKANVRGTVAPIPVVYGKRRVGGVLAQAVTSGSVLSSQSGNTGRGGFTTIDTSQSDNKYLNLVVCWSEGEIEGVQNLYFNDKLSTSSDFAGFFTVEHYTGTETQAASASLLASLAMTYTPETVDTLWTTNHKLLGVAYTYGKFTYNSKAWVSGVPVMTAEVKGIKVLDIRDSTTAWSDNPALCIYDYLTNARYGRGIDPSEIDTQSFIDAANYCDQEIFIQTGGDGILDPIVGVTQARYGCDALLNPDDGVLENLKVLLSTCRGALVFSGGLYKLKIDKPEASTFNLTEDNIVGGWSIQLEGSQSRFNRIHAQWIDRNNKYQEDIAILDSETFLLADNSEVLEARIDLPATCNYLRPLQMAGMALRQSRYSLQCEVTCTIEGLAVEVFDVVSVTHETPGWTDQLVRVMGVRLESDDQVRLQLMQYADAVYDLDSQNDEDSPPPTGLPDPRVVADIEIFAAGKFNTPNGDGTNRYYYRLEWGTLVDNLHLRGFNVRWRVAGVSGWNSAIIPYYHQNLGSPGRLHYFDLYVPPLTSHEVELEAFNSIGVVGNTYSASLTGISL